MENIKKKSSTETTSLKKEKTKQKKKSKNTETKFEISEDTLNIIKKYKVDKVFINHSKISDDNILIPLIINHKVLEYKCHQSKCKVGSEWCGSPIKLLLERINNKSDDLRIKNLRFTCYNCYFVNNSTNFNKLFVKMKKDSIIECKICKYNISNMGKTFQEMKICKMCFKTNTNNTTYFKGKNLFLNTFDNNLTEDDFNKNKNTIDYSNEVLDMSQDMFLDEKMTSKNFKKSKQNNPGKINKQSKNKKETNIPTSLNLININIEDLNMDDMNFFSKMINDK